MSDDEVEVDLPFLHVRVGAGGVKVGVGDDADEATDMQDVTRDEYREARRRVRRRLRFLRHAFTFVAANTFFFVIDWATGGGFWVQWVALIWGAILAWQFLTTFVTPAVFGHEAEQRMIERELRRRREP